MRDFFFENETSIQKIMLVKMGPIWAKFRMMLEGFSDIIVIN